MYIPMILRSNKWLWISAVLLVAGLAVGAWMKQGYLLATYHAYQLAQASEAERESYVPILAALDGDAIWPLVSRLSSANEKDRNNSAWAWGELAKEWGYDDFRSQEIVVQVGKSLPKSGECQACALAVVAECAGPKPSAAWQQSATVLLQRAAKVGHPTLRFSALRLAFVLARSEAGLANELQVICQDLIRSGLADHRPECRTEAVRLASLPQVDLLRLTVTLVIGPKQDTAPEVRRMALLAIGGKEELAATDDLLPLLHDSDGEVRAICEKALRGRGLIGAHILLARMMTDPQPAVRARVPAQVQEFQELDLRLWLDRLSRDPSPAVRAAVARAAGEAESTALQDRLKEMAGSDPSPTVQQIAHFYLTRRQALNQ